MSDKYSDIISMKNKSKPRPVSSYTYFTLNLSQNMNVLSNPVDCFSIVSSLYKTAQILLFNGLASYPLYANCSGINGLGKCPGE